jgi:hypothetical protein
MPATSHIGAGVDPVVRARLICKYLCKLGTCDGMRMTIRPANCTASAWRGYLGRGDTFAQPRHGAWLKTRGVERRKVRRPSRHRSRHGADRHRGDVRGQRSQVLIGEAIADAATNCSLSARSFRKCDKAGYGRCVRAQPAAFERTASISICCTARQCTTRAAGRLCRAGRCRQDCYWGVSNFDVVDMIELRGSPAAWTLRRPGSYNLTRRGIE